MAAQSHVFYAPDGVAQTTWTVKGTIIGLFVRYEYSDFKSAIYNAVFDLRGIGAGAVVENAALSFDANVIPQVAGNRRVSLPQFKDVEATPANITAYLNSLGGRFDNITIQFKFTADLDSPGTQKISSASVRFTSIQLTLLIDGNVIEPEPLAGVITGGVDYEFRPVLYDRQYNLIGTLNNASAVSYRRVRNDLYTASFELPKEDEMIALCKPHSIVALYDDGKFDALYRIVSQELCELTRAEEKIKFTCEHVIGFLRDDVYDGVVTASGSVGGVIQSILSQQTVQRWRLGTCEFGAFYDYEFRNQSLLSALFEVPEKMASDYHWTYDLTAYPWTVNLVRQSGVPQCAIRDGENLVTLRREVYGGELYTRLYCRGFDNLGIEEINPTGLPYLVAPDEMVEKYGVVSGNYVDNTIKDARTLYEMGQKALVNHMQPRDIFEVSALDIYRLTGKAEHKFDEGAVTEISYAPMGIKTYAMIKSVERPDIFGNPLAVSVEIETMNLADVEKPVDPEKEVFVIYDGTFIDGISWVGNELPRSGYTKAGKYSLAHAAGERGQGGYLMPYIGGSTGSVVTYNSHVMTKDAVKVPIGTTRLLVHAMYTEGGVNMRFGLLPDDAPNSQDTTRGGQMSAPVGVTRTEAEYSLALDETTIGATNFHVVINAIGTSGAGEPVRNLIITKVWFE